MQKSGSAYFYNVINELVIRTGGKDARDVKAAHGLDRVMQWHNNNIGKLSLAKLIKLWRVSLEAGTFVVKTHKGPSLATSALNRLRLIKVIYGYRDPRDVLLSAIDHGKRILDTGGDPTFARMVDFDTAVQEVESWLRIWKRYAAMPGILMLRYEDMVDNAPETVQAIEQFLGLSIGSEERQEILWKYSRSNPDGDRTAMHFNKAKTFRYKTEMTQEQKAKCQAAFGEYLASMRYEVE